MRSSAVATLSLFLLPFLAAAQDVPPDMPDTAGGSADREGVVVLCPITEMVDDGMLMIVERAIETAADAEALIFMIDTPGGRVDAAVEISKRILSASMPTVACVRGMGAISAGALIAYSCDDIVMEPGTNIGASAPVVMGGGETSETMDEKTKSYLRSRYRALGEENGHEPLFGEAMADEDIEVRAWRGPDGKHVFFRRFDEGGEENSGLRGLIESFREAADSASEKEPEKALDKEAMRRLKELLGNDTADRVREVFDVLPLNLARRLLSEDLPPSEDVAEEVEKLEQAPPVILEDGSEMVSPAGELLTLSSSQAWRYRLIPVKVNNVGEAMNFFGWQGLRKEEIRPTQAEQLYRWLTSPMIAGILLLLGIGGIYMEVRTPGLGLPGLIGVSCLAIFFGSHLVIGLADWVDLLLVLAGLVLLAIEIFITPGFGLPGTAGILCLCAGVYLALTRVTIPQYSWDYARLEDAGVTLSVALGLFALFVVLTWRLFPKTPFARWLVLADAQLNAEGYTVQRRDEADSAVGLRGVTTTMLRPAGKGRFAGRTYDLVSRIDYIEKGAPVEIVEVDGNRYVVERNGES
jgi:membrane-bound serine protease (ClpP class)